VYGIGDATLNGREKAVVSYLEDHVIPCLIGMDPRNRRTSGNISIAGPTGAAAGDDARDRRGGRGAVGHQGQDGGHAALPTAGRAQPRWGDGLWSCQWRRHCRNGRCGGPYIDLGYKAIRAQTGVPGIKDAYGVGRGKLFYEPADAALPS
jgi:mannonate dehydratase